MPTSPVLPLLLLAALALAACDQRPVSTPAPTVDTVRAEAVALRPGTNDPSVPAADSVLTPATAASNANATGTRTNRAMTPGQERNTMPLAGQANDHSAPLAQTKPASAP